MPDELTFTGERLHEDSELFGVDLARHRAAYVEAIRIGRALGVKRVLELGSGTGYGTRELAEELPFVVAVDRVAPLSSARRCEARFIRADLEAMPIGHSRFDLIVSFQVIEHLADPTAYLEAIASGLTEDGLALISTPNRTFSDGQNPFHVHEYQADELAAKLSAHFQDVEMLGVSARGPALAYHEERLERIRKIVRLDPLGLRHQLPTALVHSLFAIFARVVRRGIAREGGIPDVELSDFPIEPAHPRALDLSRAVADPVAEHDARRAVSQPEASRVESSRHFRYLVGSLPTGSLSPLPRAMQENRERSLRRWIDSKKPWAKCLYAGPSS